MYRLDRLQMHSRQNSLLSLPLCHRFLSYSKMGRLVLKLGSAFLITTGQHSPAYCWMTQRVQGHFWSLEVDSKVLFLVHSEASAFRQGPGAVGSEVMSYCSSEFSLPRRQRQHLVAHLRILQSQKRKLFFFQTQMGHQRFQEAEMHGLSQCGVAVKVQEAMADLFIFFYRIFVRLGGCSVLRSHVLC